MTNDAKTGTVDINGTKLYYELGQRAITVLHPGCGR